MEIKILLLSAMKYEDKETKKPKLRLGYILFGKDAYQNSDKFKGYKDLGGYVDVVDGFELLKQDDFLSEAILVGEELPSATNPFKKYVKLKELRTKNATISLL